MPDYRIIEGDCRDVLRSMPAQSVHTVVTSPPYFGLRDYQVPGQIGLEPTPDEFVATMVAVFREVRRVLRDDGTCWLNLGDSYATGTNADRGPTSTEGPHVPASWSNRNQAVRRSPVGYKAKDLLGMPWMVAFALRADGWYLRSDIVWSKPNPMPESVTDRPTKSHEYVFLLSKGPRYAYDADAIREPHQDKQGLERFETSGGSASPSNGHQGWVDGGGFTMKSGGREYNPAGRNKRSVWTVATQSYAGAHFATFPPKLIEPCILAGAPERACGECGAPWVRVVERTGAENYRDRMDIGERGPGQTPPPSGIRSLNGATYKPVTRATDAFEPSCSHGDGSARGVVLDPFAGAGTTGMVSLQHGREFVGIELSPEYARMARERIETAVRLGFRAPQNGPEQIPGQVSIFDLNGTE